MSSRRTIILIFALVISAVSVFGIFNYVQGVEEAASSEQETGTYWVVAVDIPKGTPIERAIAENMLLEVDVPLELRPDTFVPNPATELAGRVAVTNLSRNIPVVEGLFLAPDVVATGITERLAEMNLVTVTISLDQVKSAAYQIEAGDFVNILSRQPVIYLVDEQLALLPPSQRTDIPYETNREGASPMAYDARYLFQGVEVLAVDRTLTPQLGDSAPTNEDGEPIDQGVSNLGLITLAVPPEAVQLILSIGEENLYLSLIPQNYNPHAIDPVDLGLDYYPGELQELLTPYGPNGRSGEGQSGSQTVDR